LRTSEEGRRGKQEEEEEEEEEGEGERRRTEEEKEEERRGEARRVGLDSGGERKGGEMGERRRMNEEEERRCAVRVRSNHPACADMREPMPRKKPPRTDRKNSLPMEYLALYRAPVGRNGEWEA
jgi:hypothetical protein